MRLWLLSLVLAIGAWGQCSSTTYGAFTCVQQGRNAGSGVTTVSLLGASTANNLLVFLSESNNGSVNTIASIACGSNSFTQAATAIAAGGNTQRTEVWYAQNAASCTTATVTWNSNANYHALYLEEWAGAATTGALDNQGANSGNSITASTGSFAITSGDIVIAVYIFEGGTTGGQGTGFTQLDSDGFSATMGGAINAASTNPNSTDGGGFWTISAAAFKVSGGGGGGTPGASKRKKLLKLGESVN